MPFWTKVKDPINIMLMTIVTFLFIFDRHDPEERLYLKSILFVIGCIGIINFYRFTELGSLIDEVLESSIFKKDD